MVWSACFVHSRWPVESHCIHQPQGGGGGKGTAGGMLPSCSGSARAGRARVAHFTQCSSLARCSFSACSVPGWATPLDSTLGTGQVALAALVRCAASNCRPHRVHPQPLAVRTTSCVVVLHVCAQLTQLDLQNAAHLVVPLTSRLHLAQLRAQGTEAPGRLWARDSGTGPKCIARSCTPTGASTG